MVPAESGNYSDPPTPKTQSLTFCLLFAYNRRVQVAGIPSRSLSFTPESLVPLSPAGSETWLGWTLRWIDAIPHEIARDQKWEIPRDPQGTWWD